MAYTNAANAAFRLTGFTHNATSFLGKIRSMFEKIITDEPLFEDGTNTPSSRPVDSIDARVTIDYLDQTGGVAHTVAAANTTQSFSEANGSGSGTVVLGKMVPRSIRGGVMRRNAGNAQSQDFYLEGALTETYTN